MNDFDLDWMIPITQQVSSLAIGLAVLGFEYAHAIQQKKSYIDQLMYGHIAVWLVLSGFTFTAGNGSH